LNGKEVINYNAILTSYVSKKWWAESAEVNQCQNFQTNQITTTTPTAVFHDDPKTGPLEIRAMITDNRSKKKKISLIGPRG
jgi:hypothetical protein